MRPAKKPRIPDLCPVQSQRGKVACPLNFLSEKNGSLTFLSPNRTTELGRINFFNLGIFTLAFDESDAAPDAIKRVTAELYCERMDFQYTPVKA